MSTLIKIIKYQMHDLFRSRWLTIYTLFFLLLSYVLFAFNKEFSRVVISLMNVVLVIIPLISIIFGTIHFYNNKEYIVFMLSQPIPRRILYLGLYLGLALPMVFSFFAGILLPIILNYSAVNGHLEILFFLLLAGFFQTAIFTSIAFLIATINENKMMGLGLATFAWLAFSAIYDGLILLLLQMFQDYPLEKLSLTLSLLNPIDLARLLVVLKLDISALMGYTGAVFQQFFNGFAGMLISIFSMIIWVIVPFIIGIKIFSKKDF